MTGPGCHAAPDARPVALLQLVSEQAMQNLLPLLALRPVLVASLVTRVMAERSAFLDRAMVSAGLRPQRRLCSLSAMPDVAEVRGEVHRLIREVTAENPGLVPVVNITGGTKLMSIGAYLAARDTGALSLYTDTEHGRFLDGGTAGGPWQGLKLADLVAGGDLSLTPCIRALRVDIVAAANGCGRVTSSRPWQQLLPLARLLLNDERLEEECHQAAYGRGQGLMPEGRRLRAQGPVYLPSPAGEMLCDLGLMKKVRGEYWPSPDDAESRKSLATLLGGGWWEVAVAASMNEAGCFRDLRWSVQVGHKGSTTDMEEDVLALRGANIVYVSCKRGGPRQRLAAQLDEVRSRAERVGGRFAERFLALYRRPGEKYWNDLTRRARDLGIRMIDARAVREGNAWR